MFRKATSARIREELSRLGSDPVVVTSRGRPIAVIVSIQRWDELQQVIETLEGQLAELEYGPDRSIPPGMELFD